ncbi:MAG: type VI secretion system baseplate subunit TssE [Proteobacteria bacterium]|nr:type VI secretion system baseplate subunit TssE [Pseudomonadota bacterium]
MREKRLFERIREWSYNSGKRHRVNSGDHIISVVDHLKKLLNSRQGTTLMDIGFGMPDFTSLRATFPDSVRDIERSIAQTIERYEPRLNQVGVLFVDQDEHLTLFFQIQATLISETEPLNIYLESTLDAGGKMAVRG